MGLSFMVLCKIDKYYNQVKFQVLWPRLKVNPHIVYSWDYKYPSIIRTPQLQVPIAMGIATFSTNPIISTHSISSIGIREFQLPFK